MKTKVIINKLLIFVLFTVTACSSGDNIDGDIFEGIMSAKINGELVIFDMASGHGFFDLERSCYEDFHQVIGSMEIEGVEGHSIYLGFYPSQGEGEYSLNTQYITWTGPYNDGINTVGYGYNHLCNEGTVTITSTSNNRYKGVFNFIVKDNECNGTVVVTYGEFEIGQEILYDRPCM